MKGIKFWENKKNGFAVVRIHYTSDPDKDPETEVGKAWYDSVRPGMPEEGWQREMEINFRTMAGKAVYPEFTEKHIKKLKWESGPVVYRGWDFGYRHPAVHFSCLDEKDRWLWLHEEMGTDIEIGKFADHILDVTQAVFPGCKVRDFVPHDAVNVKDISTEKKERSSFAVLQSRGIMGEVTPADTKSESDNDLVGISLIRKQMLLRAGDGEFGMLVDEGCKICIEALMGGYHRSPKPERGDMVVKDGWFEHLMDAARITALNIFQPGLTESVAKSTFREPEYEFNPITGEVIG